MRFFANDSWSDWETYAPTRPLTLTGENGTRVIFVQYEDSGGNTSNLYGDSIVLDTAAPTSTVTGLAGSGDSTSFSFQWSGADSDSGVEAYYVQVNANNSDWGAWLLNTGNTSAIYSGAAVNSTLCFRSQARDRAGNLETYPPEPDTCVTVSNDPLPPSNKIYFPLVMGSSQPGDCVTSEEQKLARWINGYRNANGLPAVPVSKSMTQVAQWYVIDLHLNNPATGFDHGLACNMHSWSDQGFWSPVSYTGDHAFAAGMWNKPCEITGNVYSGNGYENAHGSSSQTTAAGAFSAWQSSPGHSVVILETGDWAGANWPAMGVGIYEHHAALWFGPVADPGGTVTQVCNIYWS